MSVFVSWSSLQCFWMRKMCTPFGKSQLYVANIVTWKNSAIFKSTFLQQMMLATFFLLMFCCRRPGRGSFSPPGNSVDQPVPHPHCCLLFLPQTLQPAAGRFLSPQQGLALCGFDTFSKQNEASQTQLLLYYHNSCLCTSLVSLLQPSYFNQVRQ